MEQIQIIHEEARQLLGLSSAQQVVALTTLSGQVHLLENQHIIDGDTADEQALLAKLNPADPVTHLVCLWNPTGGADVPSHHLRTGLVTLNPENANALVLMSNGTTRTIDSLK